MKKPPQAIDNATILRVADLSGATATGATRHTVDGQVVNQFAALAITQYKSDSGVYLFYCDIDWNPVTDTYHGDIEGAIAQAELEFGPLEFIEIVSTEDEADTNR